MHSLEMALGGQMHSRQQRLVDLESIGDPFDRCNQLVDSRFAPTLPS
jgi:hypothetical protein